MNLLRPRSLKGWLITRLFVAQCVILSLFICLNGVVASAMLLSGSVFEGIYELGTNDAVAASLSRNDEGRLVLSPSPDLARMRADDPDLWFIIRDASGVVLTEGTPPPEVAAFLPNLPLISQARLGAHTGTPEPAAGIVRWVQTDAGVVQLVTGGDGRLGLWQTVKILLKSPIQLTLFIVAIAAAVLILVTPVVVRRALRGLNRVAVGSPGTELEFAL